MKKIFALVATLLFTVGVFAKGVNFNPEEVKLSSGTICIEQDIPVQAIFDVSFDGSIHVFTDPTEKTKALNTMYSFCLIQKTQEYNAKKGQVLLDEDDLSNIIKILSYYETCFNDVTTDEMTKITYFVTDKYAIGSEGFLGMSDIFFEYDGYHLSSYKLKDIPEIKKFFADAYNKIQILKSKHLEAGQINKEDLK